jgi:hypothetical protein
LQAASRRKEKSLCTAPDVIGVNVQQAFVDHPAEHHVPDKNELPAGVQTRMGPLMAIKHLDRLLDCDVRPETTRLLLKLDTGD